MVSGSELSEKNYRRICFINWALSIPLMLLFAWPYYFICYQLNIERMIALPGSFTFALPFMITILHGHVTLALGFTHRHHYYNWLQNFPLTYGLLFHPTIVRTRFRLSLLIISGLLFITGVLIYV
ncbi:MAG: hypothetical protein ACFCU6_08015 [Balneolaceae bacterium]